MIKENGWDWELARPGPTLCHLHHPFCASSGSCDGWHMGRNGPPGAFWGAGRRQDILLDSLPMRDSSLTWILFLEKYNTALKCSQFWNELSLKHEWLHWRQAT
jgi:hypothetical protein